MVKECKDIPVIIYSGYPCSFIDYAWYENIEYLTKFSDLDTLKKQNKKDASLHTSRWYFVENTTLDVGKNS